MSFVHISTRPAGRGKRRPVTRFLNRVVGILPSAAETAALRLGGVDDLNAAAFLAAMSAYGEDAWTRLATPEQQRAVHLVKNRIVARVHLHRTLRRAERATTAATDEAWDEMHRRCFVRA